MTVHNVATKQNGEFDEIFGTAEAPDPAHPGELVVTFPGSKDKFSSDSRDLFNTMVLQKEIERPGELVDVVLGSKDKLTPILEICSIVHVCSCVVIL